jgi:hypothetical protein
MGDYFTKHHSPVHHMHMCPYYLHANHSPMIKHDTILPILQGCVYIPPNPGLTGRYPPNTTGRHPDPTFTVRVTAMNQLISEPF